MTKIKRKDRPTWHETALIDSHSGRVFLVAETPIHLLIRLKGTRQQLSLPWNIAWFRAATLAASVQRMQKINGRRRRSSVRRGVIGGVR